MAYAKNLFPVFKSAYYIWFLFQYQLSFWWFFTWIALHDVGLHFSLILVTKANAVEGELLQPCDYITKPHTWQVDVAFCWPPAQDKCGYGSSMPSHVKPKIMA